MAEYKMPDPPKGYKWAVSTEDHGVRNRPTIHVQLEGELSYHNHCTVLNFDDPEWNARVAMFLAETLIKEYFHNPPKSEPSFNGLRGYRRD